MKKSICIILSILMLCSTFTGLNITVMANELSTEQANKDELAVFSNENLIGDNLSSEILYSGSFEKLQWSLDSNGLLTISGNGDMPNFYDGTPAPWSDYRYLIKKVVIENGVTSIGYRAFDGCSGLTSITIPNSVTSIDWYAFDCCSGLTSIAIPNSVTNIGGCAFSYCSGLTSITISNSVTSIAWYAFGGCSGLKSITIPNGVTSIGWYAFVSCSGLTSIIIPNGVISIGDCAFLGCSGLKSVTIPNSVTSIGGRAFSNCDSITDVYYRGTQEQWETIEFEDEDCFEDATIHYGFSFSIGDVNLDSKINILDVTTIQKHLAQIITLDDEALALADTNGDGKINILDATQIQKYLARIIPEL